MPLKTSRQRYQEYIREVAERGAVKNEGKSSDSKESETFKPKARNRSFLQLLVAFWGLLPGHRGKVVMALATLTVSTLLALIPPAGTKLAIDYVLTDPPKAIPEPFVGYVSQYSRMQLLLLIASSVVIITLIRTAVHLWGRWYATKAVNLVQADIRRRVFEHLMELPLHRIQELKSGGSTSLIREDAGGTADLIFNMLYNPWGAIIQLIGSFVILVFVDWRLMLGGVLLLPIVWLSHRTWIYRVRPLYKDIRSRRQQIDAATTETFGGIRVVRTFGRSRSESNRFTRGTHLLARQQLMVWWSTRILEIVWEVLIPLASTGLLIYGGWQIMQSQLTLGDLMMFLVYLTMLLGPIASIASSAMSFQNNLAGLDRILDIFQEPVESAGSHGFRILNRRAVPGAIEFRNVSFRYPKTEKLILEDINFSVPAGSTVALVGRSGAGKTTLCRLVERFYRPESGAIFLDGIDFNEITLDSYRQLLGVVDQEVFLFDGTIRDNIAYGRRHASEEDIVQAAEMAAAREFIDQFPQGFETWIGERGVKLSGGQRQRLAIARAILADPRILILDEATSNLDSESERLIQASLRQLLQGRTSFVIAHRLSTIMHADQIFVLDGGRIAQRGTHRELLGQSGLYRHMVMLQTNSLTIPD